jgi:hypothetical protein
VTDLALEFPQHPFSDASRVISFGWHNCCNIQGKVRANQNRESRRRAMAARMLQIERRQHVREGILEELENITYGVLRRYAVDGDTVVSETTGTSQSD